MNNIKFIKQAEEYLNPITINDRLHGDVAAAVLAKNGKTYYGVCVDTSTWGFCAERSALAAMITDGCYEFEKVVAVWKDDDNQLYVLPPCGNCREFMRSIHDNNLEAEVVLGKTESQPLKKLLPCHEWPKALEKE